MISPILTEGWELKLTNTEMTVIWPANAKQRQY